MAQVYPGEALALAVEYTAVHFGERYGQGGCFDALGLGLGRGEAHMGDLRVGEGAPGDHQPGGFLPSREQGVGEQDAGLGVGRVGELEGRAEVAGRENARVGGPEPVVDTDAVAVEFYTRRVQAEPLDVGRTTGRDQDGVHPQLLRAACTVQIEHPLRALDAHTRDPAVQPHLDPFAGKHRGEQVGHLAVLAGKQLRPVLDQGHPAAEAGKGLGHLAAHRAAAEHGQPGGQGGEGEQGLIGQRLGRAQAGDVRQRGPGAGAQGRAVKGKVPASHLDAVRTGKATLAEEHVHAQLVAEAAGRVVAADLGPQPAHARHDCGKIGQGAFRVRSQAVSLAAAGLVRGPGGADERLGGHAAGVQTVAAKEMPLDQRHPGPEPGRAGRTDQAGRARADHHQVVAVPRLRVRPVGRVDIGHQRLVVRILGQDSDGRGHGRSPWGAVAGRRPSRMRDIQAVADSPVSSESIITARLACCGGSWPKARR